MEENSKPYLKRMKDFVQENGITGRFVEETQQDRAAKAATPELPYPPRDRFPETTKGIHDYYPTPTQREDDRRDIERSAPAQRTSASAEAAMASYQTWLKQDDARADRVRDAAAERAAELAKTPGRAEYLAKVRDDAQKRFGRGTVQYDFSLES